LLLHIQTARWWRWGRMNPHGILTGLGGQRGEVVRRTVYDGALRVEDSPHAIVRDALADYLLGNAAMATATGGGGGGTRQQPRQRWRCSRRGDSGDGPTWQRQQEMADLSMGGRLTA
jgi:hypothetical protein